MAISKDQRIYNMIDADLCMFTSNLCNILTRDQSDLIILGLDNTKISALKALGDAFEVFPPDDVYIGEIMIATKAKNDLADQVRETVRTMAMRVEANWGVDSGEYKTLKVFGMNQVTDSMLLGIARNVHLRLTGYLLPLTPFGLTSDMLDDFNLLNESFEHALNLLSDKILLRDQKSRERVTKGNELYELVVRYCDFGKRIFAMSDPAKYNDYIIYTATSPGSLTAPADLSFYFPLRSFSWSPVENATSYVLYYSATGEEDDYTEIYAGAATEFVFTPTNTSWFWVKCRARNANGLGQASILKAGFYEVLPPPVNLNVELISGSTDTIKLDFDEVPSVTKYKIYRSTANVGDVAGSFVYAGQSDVNSFIESVSAGHRYYYRCTAENPYQTSTNSSEVYIEL